MSEPVIPRKTRNRVAQITLSVYVSDDLCSAKDGHYTWAVLKKLLEESNYRDFIIGQLPEEARSHVAVDATEYFFDALTVCKELLDVWKRAGPQGSNQLEKFEWVVRLAREVVAKRPQHFPPTSSTPAAPIASAESSAESSGEE
jgi:hypothetical protein